MAARNYGADFAAGILFFSAALLLGGCSSGETSEVEQVQPVTVRVAPVTSDARAEPLRFAGTVQPRQRADLTFQVSGTLQERPIKLGQAVAEGDLLAKLYNPQLEPAKASARAKLQELQVQVKQAARELKRAEALHKKGVQSVQVVEQARAAHDVLKAGVATAKAQLAEADQMAAETELRAPFAGRVESIPVEKGEFISPGQLVVSMAAADAMEVEIKVPAYLLENLRAGDGLPVWLVRDRSTATVPAKVAEIAQSSGGIGELQTVIVLLEDPPSEAPVIRNRLSESPPPKQLAAVPVAGTPVEVGILPRNELALSVPMLSVMRSRNGAAVFKVADGKAERVRVDIVQLLGEEVLIRSDNLNPNDSVVFAGLSRLADGDAIEVLP